MAFLGRNKLILNQATMKTIIDRYFDDIMFSKYKDFEVTEVNYLQSEKMFEVTIEYKGTGKDSDENG